MRGIRGQLAGAIIILSLACLCALMLRPPEERRLEGVDAFRRKPCGIVYILPSGASTPFWRERYGDRIYFYVHANLSECADLIRRDFVIISKHYDFVIIVLPADDTPQYFENLATLDRLAAECGLKILFAIFPKSKYGPEPEYLRPGTAMNKLIVRCMQFMANLKSTWKIAIWYGWKGHRHDASEIRTFYDNLPPQVKPYYTIWLDGPFVKPAIEARVHKLANKLGITVVTELYSKEAIQEFSGVFGRQIVVTGVANAPSAKAWTEALRRKIAHARCPAGYEPRILAIWIFNDVNDGHGEAYRAYINGELLNPFETS